MLKNADYYENTLGLHVNVETKVNRIRPKIIPHQSEHDLIKEWENGIRISEAERRVEKLMNNVG